MLIIFVFAKSRESTECWKPGLGNAVKLYNPNGPDPTKTTGKTSLRLCKKMQPYICSMDNVGNIVRTGSI